MDVDQDPAPSVISDTPTSSTGHTEALNATVPQTEELSVQSDEELLAFVTAKADMLNTATRLATMPCCSR
jgi:hypothetical protein